MEYERLETLSCSPLPYVSIHFRALLAKFTSWSEKENVEALRVTDGAPDGEFEGTGDWKVLIVCTTLYSNVVQSLAKTFSLQCVFGSIICSHYLVVLTL